MSEIDHRYTKEIVCPYCGYEFRDSWELAGDDGDEQQTDCDECGKDFLYYADIDVTYCTRKIKKDA